ncbi:hypothetical protein OSTOST_25721, partial [Ostertagia ostertagi]
MKDVEAPVLEALINFCYFGKIRISSTNVWSVLPTACLLQLNEVKEQCSEFLEKQLNASNLLEKFELLPTLMRVKSFYAVLPSLSCTIS